LSSNISTTVTVVWNSYFDLILVSLSAYKTMIWAERLYTQIITA